MFNFAITSRKGKARTGVFQTPHGAIETPVFMPVGTYGAVKTLAPWELESLGSQIILSNTYHLYLRPGDQEIAKLGGLHQFMNWPHPILTDSGGFQVYSIGERQKISEEGIIFRSHIDGSAHKFIPEKSIQIQKNLGADIIMTFDDVAGVSQGRKELKIAMTRTHRWLERCLVELDRLNLTNKTNRSNWTNGQQPGASRQQAIFGIVQGGFEKDLRQKSAEFVASKNLSGNAIGGLAMPGDQIIEDGKQRTEKRKEKLENGKAQMWKTVEQVCEILPEDKPRYLMGVGEPANLVQAVNLGCDMFDCVLPTRLARHGTVWVITREKDRRKKKEESSSFYSRINLFNARFKADPRPIDENCSCPACRGIAGQNIEYRRKNITQGFSRAYLRHLLVSGEVLGIRLLSIHNIWFINQLLEQIKREIK